MEEKMEAEIVWVRHFRYGTLGKNRGMFPAAVLRQFGETEPMGGMTLALVSLNGQNALGTAFTLPDENFSRSLGRSIAVGRAMKQLKEESNG